MKLIKAFKKPTLKKRVLQKSTILHLNRKKPTTVKKLIERIKEKKKRFVCNRNY